jgi:hypothetical protein
MKYLGIVGSVGDEDKGLIERAAELEAARARADGELAELVAAQRQDERLGHLSRDRWMVSLDDEDVYGRPLHEVVAA